MTAPPFVPTLVPAHLPAAGVSFGLGLYIYGRFRTEPIARVFAAMVAAFGVWTVDSLVLSYADGEPYVSRRVVAGPRAVPVLALAARATTTSHGRSTNRSR